jgi:7-cyano-7-deazaguanine synthase
MPSTVVVILSGGMDSTTLLYDVISQGFKVHAVSFDYGQRHNKELQCAVLTCHNLKVPHIILMLDVLGEIASSSLTRDIAVPEGAYDDESMKQTVVPNRNMVMLALATSYAISIGADAVYYGAHSGDHTIYPDCRPEFIRAMDNVMKLCDWRRIELRAPYQRLTKADILEVGFKLGVDYSTTWTCYNGREKSCGKCGSCNERLLAFDVLGKKDPLEYEGDA